MNLKITQLHIDVESRILCSPNAIVHVDYNLKRLEPLLSPNWTQCFICISDNHARTYPVPTGDVLLHGGDLTRSGQLKSGFFGCPTRSRCEVSMFLNLVRATSCLSPESSQGTMIFHCTTNGMVCTTPGGIRISANRCIFLDFLNSSNGPLVAVTAGIVYLQDEQHAFRLKENGRTWTVYGSPVSSIKAIQSQHYTYNSSGLLQLATILEHSNTQSLMHPVGHTVRSSSSIGPHPALQLSFQPFQKRIFCAFRRLSFFRHCLGVYYLFIDSRIYHLSAFSIGQPKAHS